MNQQQWLDKLKKEGIKDPQVCTMEPNTKPDEHTHDQHTVHVILRGELTISDKHGTKTYKQNDYIEFPAGTTHSVQFGPKGCTMIVGVKDF
jgi:quercetin dioxygenase-like cupin family protein